MNLPTGSAPFRREVTERFGLLPNFFSSAPDAPEMVEKLWEFAKAAYLDNPMPSLFKERLFVYLSRFCEVRYCITRHCAFLLGYGHVAGDAAAPAQSLEDAIRLLTKPTPWQRTNDDWLRAFESSLAGSDWPAPDTDLRISFSLRRRSCLSRRDGQTAPATRCDTPWADDVMSICLGSWLLSARLTIGPYSTLTWRRKKTFSRFSTRMPNSPACCWRIRKRQDADLGTQLYAELEDLRDLRERRKLELANQALAHEVAQKEFLLKEVNHRSQEQSADRIEHPPPGNRQSEKHAGG